MKRVLILAVVFQFTFCNLANGTLPVDPTQEAAYQTVKARLRIEHPYLTKFLGLKEEFNLDDRRNLKLLDQRFPVGIPITRIEAELRAAVIKDNAVRISFGHKPDQLWIAVRFITEKPKLYETKYTFTFEADAQRNLIKTYYLTEHYSGGLSDAKDENTASGTRSKDSKARSDLKK